MSVAASAMNEVITTDIDAQDALNEASQELTRLL